MSDFGRMWRRALRKRCVLCGEGRPFAGWLKVRERCSVCGHAHAREPGYFLGSIYLNYGLTGALLMIWVVVAAFVLDLDQSLQVGLPVLFVLIFPFWFLRYARGLWMAIDLSIDPPAPGEFACPADQEGPDRRVED
ncbi:MAG: DUF983 domain-containing protein [Planctomycetes bacterium]|nr:DUF983 domain-containing protein [Planctomycetota bacterium]